MTQAQTRKQHGHAIERTTARFLEGEGLKLVDQNYQCKMGELDLIMLDGTSLVFIEVRYRRSADHGSGAETVTRHKQRKLIRTAQRFLQQYPQWQQAPCRFDVISVSQASDPARDDYDFDWIQDAFWA